MSIENYYKLKKFILCNVDKNHKIRDNERGDKMKNNLHIVLRQLRDEQNKTQTELANDLHISQKTYSNYENGTRQPSIDTLIDIANYYRISIDYLVGRYKLTKED